MIAFLRDRQRQRLREQPFPADWEQYLTANVPHIALLTAEEQERLRDDIKIIIGEKYWEGCNGLIVTDEMRVTVAAFACLLQLNLPHRDYYSNVQTILLYPSYYRVKHKRYETGILRENVESRAGEAWSHNGPIVLAWDEVLTGGQYDTDGHNVVLHEFAHKLDMLDSSASGVPMLENQAAYEVWAQVMSAEYAALVSNTEAGIEGLIDSYGAKNPMEFFAVVTEVFFEQPHQLQEEHPRLYDIFRDFYRQDPAARMLAWRL